MIIEHLKMANPKPQSIVMKKIMKRFEDLSEPFGTKRYFRQVDYSLDNFLNRADNIVFSRLDEESKRIGVVANEDKTKYRLYVAFATRLWSLLIVTTSR